MKVKNVIKVHLDKLNKIDSSKSNKDFNNNRWLLGVFCFAVSLVLSYFYSWAIMFIGVGLYAYFSYTAVKW